jgi:hypothetical protein
MGKISLRGSRVARTGVIPWQVQYDGFQCSKVHMKVFILINKSSANFSMKKCFGVRYHS